MSRNNQSKNFGTTRWMLPVIRLMERNPRKSLAAMVGTMAISIAGATIYNVTKKPYVRKVDSPVATVASPDITHGVAELWRSGTAVYEAMKLESEISGLLENVDPTGTDSVELVRSLRRLQDIQQKLNPVKR